MKLESNFSRLYNNLVNPRERKLRNELYVFLICLVISIFIWFLIALSKESYTSLDYPVEFINVPADMALVNKPDSVLTFRISSGGFELFTLRYLSPRTPITIDLGSISMEKQDGFYAGNYNTARLSSRISKQYRFAEELISISPENLYFRFEPLTGKMVPVVSGLKLEFQSQFRLADSIAFSPAKVKVVGPRNLIDKINEVATEAIRVPVKEGRTTGSCPLINPYSGDQVALVPEQVDFALKSERFTESTLTIPIVPADDGVMIKTFPQQVEVTFLVSLDNFKRVDTGLFTAAIELTESSGSNSKAAVKLLKVPAFIEVTKIEPAEVDFLMLQK